MAVAVLDNPGTTVNTAGFPTTLSLVFTVSSGSNTALIAAFTYGDATANLVTSVVWDPTGANQALTLIRQDKRATAGFSSNIWGLVNPTPGTSKNLTVTWNGGIAGVLGAVSFSGVNQTGGTTTFSNAVGTVRTTGTNPSQAISSNVGDQVVAVEVNDNSNVSAVSNTQIFIDNTVSNQASGSNTATGAASVTLTITAGATNSCISGCNIAAAGAAGAVNLPPAGICL